MLRAGMRTESRDQMSSDIPGQRAGSTRDTFTSLHPHFGVYLWTGDYGLGIVDASQIPEENKFLGDMCWRTRTVAT